MAYSVPEKGPGLWHLTLRVTWDNPEEPPKARGPTCEDHTQRPASLMLRANAARSSSSAWGHFGSRLALVWSTEIAAMFAIFAIAMPVADPRNRAISEKREKAMLHCDLRVRWKVASDLRFRAAISESKTPSFCGISGDLAQSTRKSLAISALCDFGALKARPCLELIMIVIWVLGFLQPQHHPRAPSQRALDLMRLFPPLSCDPDCLVQPPNSRTAPKSIGEGASSLFGRWPGSPENVSCSRATPDLHRCNLGVALEQETFSGLPDHLPKDFLLLLLSI